MEAGEDFPGVAVEAVVSEDLVVEALAVAEPVEAGKSRQKTTCLPVGRK